MTRNCNRDGHDLAPGGQCRACRYHAPADVEQGELFAPPPPVHYEEPDYHRNTKRGARAHTDEKRCATCGGSYFMPTPNGKCGLCNSKGA